jgi:DNA modification methylase
MKMSKITQEPEIQRLLLSSIKPDPENPREISDEAFSGLKKSLEKFGYVDLLIVNKRNMTLVSGHQRYKALIESQITEAVCILVDLDELDQKALAVTMNSQQIVGSWTAAIIPILERLRNEMPMEYVGLRLDELRKEVAEFELENTGQTQPDDIPEGVPAVTKFGDIWELGTHRLMCGDSTKADDVAKLFNGEKAKLFSTDPPYLVDYTGADRPGGGKDWSDKYHEIEIKDVQGFFSSIYQVGFQFVEPNVAIYMWHADKRVRVINEILESLGVMVHQTIIWVKPAILMTYAYFPWRHEPCLFGWKKGFKPHLNSAAKWSDKNTQNNSTVWRVDLLRSGDPMDPAYYSDIWEVDFEGKKRNNGKLHPTTKPTELFAIPMRIHTQPGDICYEPFSGSGSQIIAGERVNRRVFAMEIEPHFVDVAVKRWEDFTGKKAELLK